MGFPFSMYFLRIEHFYSLSSQQFLELCFLDKENQLVSQMVESLLLSMLMVECLLLSMLYFVVSSIL